MATISLRHGHHTNDLTQSEERLYSPPLSVGVEFGFIMMLVAFFGVFFPSFLGLNLSVMHCLVLGCSGALSIWGALAATSYQSYLINLGLGVFFLLNAVVGALVGEPSAPRFNFYTSEQLERMAPGFLQLATTDHIVHGLLALVFFFEAYSWHVHHRNQPIHLNKRVVKVASRALGIIVVASVIVTVVSQIRGFP
jgi:ABC-type xylose transport system permease subunit